MRARGTVNFFQGRKDVDANFSVEDVRTRTSQLAQNLTSQDARERAMTSSRSFFFSHWRRAFVRRCARTYVAASNPSRSSTGTGTVRHCSSGFVSFHTIIHVRSNVPRCARRLGSRQPLRRSQKVSPLKATSSRSRRFCFQNRTEETKTPRSTPPSRRFDASFESPYRETANHCPLCCLYCSRKLGGGGGGGAAYGSNSSGTAGAAGAAGGVVGTGGGAA